MRKRKEDRAPEIAQDLSFQRRQWAAERFAWGLIWLVIVLAILGLFGHGLLGGTRAEDPEGLLRVEYDAFGRHQSPATHRFFISPRAAGGGEVRLWLDRAYTDGVLIEHVTPQPRQVEAAPGGVTYVFAVGDAGAPAEVTFRVTLETIGPLRGRAKVPGGSEVSLSPFIYP